MQKQIIELFRSYRWNELYEEVKNVRYDSKLSLRSQHSLAIKAMLLVAWWSDNITSKEILKLYPPLITDFFTHFCVTYAYMCLGDKQKMKWYLSKIPKNSPKWMRSYLDIEYFGRSLQFEKQMKLVRKLTPANQYPQDYIKVALLQSLEHDQADISYLQRYIQEIKLTQDTDPLSMALCLRAGMIDIDTIDSKVSPLLLARKANYLLRTKKVLDSLKSYDALANTKFLDINTINQWLAVAISLPQAKEYFLQRADFALSLVPNSLFVQGTVSSYALIFSYLQGDYKTAYNIVQKYHNYKELPKTKFTKNAQIFFNYILNLCVFWQHNRSLYIKASDNLKLSVFGESHSLSLSNINFKLNYNNFNANSNFIMGIKMYHLANTDSSYHANCLKEHIKFIQPNSNLLFTIGEIDARPDEGIWQVHLEKGKDVDTIINDTVNGYIDFLADNLKDKLLSVTIQGIPAPNYALEGDKDPKDEKGFLSMIKIVNDKLKELTLEKGWYFLDVYSATLGDEGKSNKKWHIDGYHLSPLFYVEEADKWLVKPKIQAEPKSQTIDFSKYTAVSLNKPRQ